MTRRRLADADRQETGHDETETSLADGRELASCRVIMLLDDDSGMRDSLRFLLGLSGYTVAAYADPAPLLRDLGAIDPACVIIDVHLAGADGIAVGRAALAMRPDLHMILITARADQRIRNAVVELGVAALLEKPFSEATLLAAIGQGSGDAAPPDVPRTA